MCNKEPYSVYIYTDSFQTPSFASLSVPYLGKLIRKHTGSLLCHRKSQHHLLPLCLKALKSFSDPLGSRTCFLQKSHYSSNKCIHMLQSACNIISLDMQTDFWWGSVWSPRIKHHTLEGGESAYQIFYKLHYNFQPLYI